MSAEAPPAIAEDMKFEEAIERLESIVRKMEEERVPLDELIRDYESGSRLLGICRNRIAKARERVEVISGSLADGGTRLEGFNDGDAAALAVDGSGGTEPDDVKLL